MGINRAIQVFAPGRCVDPMSDESQTENIQLDAGAGARGSPVLVRPRGLDPTDEFHPKLCEHARFCLSQTCGCRSLLLRTFCDSPRVCGSVVPKGRLTLAQRFIAGNAALTDKPSPVGTNESFVSIESSLRDSDLGCPHDPSDESLGYSRLPLRGIARHADHRKAQPSSTHSDPAQSHYGARSYSRRCGIVHIDSGTTPLHPVRSSGRIFALRKGEQRGGGDIEKRRMLFVEHSLNAETGGVI